MVERRVLLPGATVLARLVTSAREATTERLLLSLGGRMSTDQTVGLEMLLVVEDDSRASRLERLRQAPTRISSTGMVSALERLGDVEALGVSAVDVSELPVGRVRELARYGMAAKAQAIGRLSPARRAATLLAVAKHLETVANDDGLDLFDALAAQLVGRSGREGDKDRLKQLPRLAKASASLALAVEVLFDADENLSLRQVWDAIEACVPRAELVTATSTVAGLAHEVDRDDVLRSHLVERYLTARRFLPVLTETIAFEATPAGTAILEAVRALSGLWGRKKVGPSEVALGVVPAAWRRLVLPEPGEVDRRAYTLCVMEELHQALRRREVFSPASSRWADPRAGLLDGERWAAVRSEMLDGLGLTADPGAHLEALAAKLDDAYRSVAAGLGENTLLSIDGYGRPHLAPDEALPMPPRLVALKSVVASMLPQVDLPELLIEVDAWTGFTSEFLSLIHI